MSSNCSLSDEPSALKCAIGSDNTVLVIDRTDTRDQCLNFVYKVWNTTSDTNFHSVNLVIYINLIISIMNIEGQ